MLATPPRPAPGLSGPGRAGPARAGAQTGPRLAARTALPSPGAPARRPARAGLPRPAAAPADGTATAESPPLDAATAEKNQIQKMLDR